MKEEVERKEKPDEENGVVNISESNFTVSDGLLHINLPNILKLNSADFFANQDLLRDSKSIYAKFELNDDWMTRWSITISLQISFRTFQTTSEFLIKEKG